MNSVERVKGICKERKIPISKLEKDLEFGNGYIGQLKKGMFPADRLSKIAKYLSVSEQFLLTGQEAKKAPTLEGEQIQLSGTYLRLAKGAQDLGLDDDDVDAILALYTNHLKKNSNLQ